MDSLLSFPVGLFHPLQHAGLSRRSLVCQRLAQNLILHLPQRVYQALTLWRYNLLGFEQIKMKANEGFRLPL
jgi:hypothetical protein